MPLSYEPDASLALRLLAITKAAAPESATAIRPRKGRLSITMPVGTSVL